MNWQTREPADDAELAYRRERVRDTLARGRFHIRPVRLRTPQGQTSRATSADIVPGGPAVGGRDVGDR